MTHCHFSVHYGDPNFVSITSQSSTPIKRRANKNAKDASSLTLTAVGHTDSQRLQMKNFAQAWTKASTVEEFAQHMTEFQSMLKGKWKALAQPVPPSSLAYHFVLEPLQEKVPKRTIGFRRLNDERAFDKMKPAASVARDP
jgi:hypothetical protein